MKDDEAALEKNGMRILREVSPEFAEKLRNSSEELIIDWMARVGPNGKSILVEFEKQRKKP